MSLGRYIRVSEIGSLRLEMIRRYSSAARTTVNQCFSGAARAVVVGGWVQSVRKMKETAFLIIADGSSADNLTVVISPDLIRGIRPGACVDVQGTLQSSPGKEQKIELSNVTNLKILGPASEQYPLQKKHHTNEFLRKIPEYRWKAARASSILRYRSQALNAVSQFFKDRDFTMVTAPVMTASDCEGAGQTFGVELPHQDYFGNNKKVVLTVSSQLHLEVLAGALGRVWTYTPVFRAERSDTNRHLCEFWMIEAEVAFVDELGELMDIVESCVRAAIRPILDGPARALGMKPRLDRLAQIAESSGPWSRMTYTEAVAIIQKEFGPESIEWGDSLKSEHEKHLASRADQPIFVTNYPARIKPFYMKRDPHGLQESVACFDLIVPEVGELAGGSLREDGYNELIQNMTKQNIDLESMTWYSNLRKEGSFPHGGFGIGFERLVSFVTGTDNVRDVVPFPRHASKCVC